MKALTTRRTWMDPQLILREHVPHEVPGDWTPLRERLHAQWAHLTPGIRLSMHRVPPSLVTNHDVTGPWWVVTAEHPIGEEFRPRKVWNGAALEMQTFSREMQDKAMSFYSFFAPSYLLVSFEQPMQGDVWVQCLVKVRR